MPTVEAEDLKLEPPSNGLFMLCVLFRRSLEDFTMNVLRWSAALCLLMILGCGRPLPPPTEHPYLRTLLDTDQPVLLDCWASWCGPCRQLAPVIDQLAAEYRGRAVVAKLDVDEHPDVARHLGVSAIPALLLFQDGQLVRRLIGVQPKSTLETALDELLAKKS